MAAARDMIAQMLTTGKYAGSFNDSQSARATCEDPNIRAAATEITILFAYTDKAAVAAGSPAEIKKRVDVGMTNLNAAFVNNGIGYTVKAIAEYVEVEYDAAPTEDDVDALLAELRNPDGKFNKVHQYRKQKQADVVCLIFTGFSMGKADLNGSMMVMHHGAGAFGGSYVFPHEFGHVMGATHEAGKRFTIGNTTYRTISNNGGVSIPYYSQDKKTITYMGQSLTIGDAEHDNAGTILKNASAKSNLGENLPNVPASANAAPAKLVNPATAPTPPGGPFCAVISFTCTQKGHITITYISSDATEFKVEGFDDKGKSFGGFGGQLDPSKTLLESDFYELFPGDKYVMTIGGKEVGSYTQQ
ncbi:MAG: M12 family metallo-peptidase, partial [Bacteroidota bacterium]